MIDDDPVKLGFVCVQNAGRSQMSYAFAEREVERRGLDGHVELLTGGTHPADHVHEEVVDAMAAVGIDVSGRTPREVTDAELNECDYVATMGCSTLSLSDSVEARDWPLADPDGKSPEAVAAVRDEIESEVVALFDEAFGEHGSDGDAAGDSAGADGGDRQ
ncbi:low molecular weight phosphatase family protein [Halobaculum rubrum]|uniref:low molecular weight phosphatase family protein n=1 Tax=Halobaculum rubrum TaxID=2872158 RepID=UPI001CA40684|nr:low molecular weight phosphatase family protein [Halobaculum rubrum]QZX98700.1 low molecular weight phosphatase family protein [Halobaculum rubrum]